MPAGARALDLGAVAASGRVIGIEQIELAGGKTLALAAADVAAISGGNLLTIGTDAGDTVRLIGAWSTGAPETVGGVTFTRYTSGSAAVLVENGATMVLGGSTAGTSGLDQVAAGDAAPLPGGVSGAVLQDTITVAQYIAFSDLIIGQDETWQSPNGGAVLSAYGGTVDIVNHGRLLSYGDVGNGLGTAIAYAPLSGISSFLNTGTILADASGSATAFYGSSMGLLTNRGNIHAHSQSGDASAAVVYEERAVNEAAGDIFAYSDTGFATGIRFGNGGNLHNRGTIEADGGDGAIAVDMWNRGGILLNDGEILASAPVTSSFYSIGAYFSLDAHVTNNGVIAAEVAILISARDGRGSDVTNHGDIYGSILLLPQQSYFFADRITIQNTGRIFGDIVIAAAGAASDTVINSGLIEGLIELGGGNDTFNGTSGVQTGLDFRPRGQ